MVKSFITPSGKSRKFVGGLRTMFEFAIYSASRRLNMIKDKRVYTYGVKRKRQEAEQRIKEFR